MKFEFVSLSFKKIGRLTYMVNLIFWDLMFLLGVYLVHKNTSLAIIGGILIVLSVINMWFVFVNRLSDMNQSKWQSILFFLPIIGWYYCLKALFTSSKGAKNSKKGLI